MSGFMHEDGTWSLSHYFNFEVTIHPITSNVLQISHSTRDFRAFDSTLFRAITTGFRMGLWQGLCDKTTADAAK